MILCQELIDKCTVKILLSEFVTGRPNNSAKPVVLRGIVSFGSVEISLSGVTVFLARNGFALACLAICDRAMPAHDSGGPPESTFFLVFFPLPVFDLISKSGRLPNL